MEEKEVKEVLEILGSSVAGGIFGSLLDFGLEKLYQYGIVDWHVFSIPNTGFYLDDLLQMLLDAGIALSGVAVKDGRITAFGASALMSAIATEAYEASHGFGGWPAPMPAAASAQKAYQPIGRYQVKGR
jgi:hypothetical protein